MSNTATLTPPNIPAEIAEAVPVLFRGEPKPKPSPLGRLPEPGEIPAIFKRIEATPVRDTFVVASNIGRIRKCDAITAGFVDRVENGYSLAASGYFLESGVQERALGVSTDFLVGAAQGWDGEAPFESDSQSTDYLAGHRWGADSQRACVAAGLTNDLAVIDEEVA